MQALLAKQPVRQAIQAGLGVALAIGIGTLISGQRWYWAVIAAFIISIGVGSRGEALVKAAQRVAGTIAGIIAGMFLAAAVAGKTNLSFGLVLVCVFFAFYAFQAAYSVMIFCITLMLALLYGLLGLFQPHLLVLRLEETAAGAAAGIIVIMLVLPIRQSDTFADAARDFLDALSAALRAMASGDERHVADATADLQSKTQALRQSVGGLKRGWLPFVPMTYRRAVRAAMRAAYVAREMAQRGGIGAARANELAQRAQAARRRLDENTRPAVPEANTHSHSDAPADRLYAAMLEATDRLDERLHTALGR
ncbi:MAG TPA: FUSC family protein [Pseudolabrys sp.]|nr:FUSC family protein [Pseudolabrys sp.]